MSNSEELYASLYVKSSNIEYSLKELVSKEYIAGIFACLDIFSEGENQVFLDNDQTYSTNITDFLNEYVLYSGMSEDDAIIANIPAGYYGLCVRTKDSETFIVYMFHSFDFIDGFIKGFDFLKKEFRNYILGSLFKTELHPYPHNIMFDIPGYDITIPVKEEKQPSPLGAYYLPISHQQYDIREMTGVVDPYFDNYPYDYS